MPTITYTLKPLSAKSAPVVINLEPKQYLVETVGLALYLVKFYSNTSVGYA